MTFIDVEPDVVFGAGRATAGTAGEWDSWAGHAETLLRGLAGDAGDGGVGGAFEGYLSAWNPTFKSCGRHATALGLAASEAAGSVTGGDERGASALRGTRGGAEGVANRLSRPINY